MNLPITFPDDEVRAILDGRMSQSRRVVIDVDPQLWNLREVAHAGDVSVAEFIPQHNSLVEPIFVRCPFGKPGAELRVREAWAPMDHMAGIGSHSIDPPEIIGYRADETAIRHAINYQNGKPTPFAMDVRNWNFQARTVHWRSPQHLYRWATRIFLQVESIHIEKLQDISADDAIEQGCRSIRKDATRELSRAISVDTFRRQWNAANHRRVYHKWDRNPFVWKLIFKTTKIIPGDQT